MSDLSFRLCLHCTDHGKSTPLGLTWTLEDDGSPEDESFRYRSSQDESQELRLILTGIRAEDHEAEDIALHLQRKCPLSWITSIDWAAIAQDAASFPHVTRVSVFGAGNSGQEASYKEHGDRHLKSLAQQRGIELNVAFMRGGFE